MKKFFYLLIITLTLIGCSSDSSNSDNNPTMTFLENYNGTKWFASNENGFVYNRFLNNVNIPFEFWIYSDNLNPNDCYLYFLANFEDLEQGTTYEVTENLDDVFEYRTVYTTGDDDENIGIITYTVNENNMQVEENHYLNGVLDLSEIVFWTQTSDDVDNLTICN